MMAYYMLYYYCYRQSLWRFGLVSRNIFHLNGLNYHYCNSEKYARGRTSAHEIAATMRAAILLIIVIV